MTDAATAPAPAPRPAGPPPGVPGPGRAAIEMRGVDKAFGDLKVLTGFDLFVEKGETFTILGPSGCGKSVTLKIVISPQTCRHVRTPAPAYPGCGSDS